MYREEKRERRNNWCIERKRERERERERESGITRTSFLFAIEPH